MSVAVLLIIACLIAVGFIFDINIGPIAICVALLIGKIFLGLKTVQVLEFIPLNALFTVILISTFYGFAMENGAAQIFISKATRKFARTPWLTSIVIFAITTLAAGLGLGTNVSLIVAPIAMQIAMQSNIHPLLMAVAVSGGSTIGSNLPFSMGGSIACSLIEGEGFVDNAFHTVIFASGINAAVQGIIFALCYVVLKGFRCEPADGGAADSYGEIHRRTAKLVIFVVLCGALPTIAANVLHIDGLSRFAEVCDLNFALLVGIILAERLHIADVSSVLRNRVPVMLLVMISGMCMLIGIAKEAGVIAALSEFLANEVPTEWIVPLAVVIAMLMSLFAGAVSVVLPTLFPVATSLALATGIDPGLLYSAIFVGATCGGISPFSTGGLILLSACPDQIVRRRLMVQLIPLPFLLAAVAAIIFAAL